MKRDRKMKGIADHSSQKPHSRDDTSLDSPTTSRERERKRERDRDRDRDREREREID